MNTPDIAPNPNDSTTYIAKSLLPGGHDVDKEPVNVIVTKVEETAFVEAHHHDLLESPKR